MNFAIAFEALVKALPKCLIFVASEPSASEAALVVCSPKVSNKVTAFLVSLSSIASYNFFRFEAIVLSSL